MLFSIFPLIQKRAFHRINVADNALRVIQLICSRRWRRNVERADRFADVAKGTNQMRPQKTCATSDEDMCNGQVLRVVKKKCAGKMKWES